MKKQKKLWVLISTSTVLLGLAILLLVQSALTAKAMEEIWVKEELAWNLGEMNWGEKVFPKTEPFQDSSAAPQWTLPGQDLLFRYKESNQEPAGDRYHVYEAQADGTHTKRIPKISLWAEDNSLRSFDFVPMATVEKEALQSKEALLPKLLEAISSWYVPSESYRASFNPSSYEGGSHFVYFYDTTSSEMITKYVRIEITEEGTVRSFSSTKPLSRAYGDLELSTLRENSLIRAKLDELFFDPAIVTWEHEEASRRLTETNEGLCVCYLVSAEAKEWPWSKIPYCCIVEMYIPVELVS